MFQNIGPGILRGDDIRSREELRVSTAMILMIMRIDDVFHRLRGDCFDLRQDCIVVLLELVVDQNDALIRHQHRDVAAIALDFVKIVVAPC